MNTYEITATITASGQLSLTGVPFAPGTQVEIAIRPLPSAESTSSVTNGAALAAARERMQGLFNTVKGFRMSPKICARNCMIAEAFVDTNILLYSIDDDPASQTKRERSQNLLLTENWGWSVQVAAEFFVNATSLKRPFRLATADAAALLDAWFAYPTLPITSEVVRAAIQLHERFQLNYWDAAIIAAARQLGCGIVYSEDLNAGQDYDGVTVINPFATATA